MKMIIDIPEGMLEAIKDGYWSGSHKLELAIRNGIPYEDRPQGDLISREALRKDIEHLYSVYKENKEWFYTDVLDHIDNAPTVPPKYFPPCEDCNKKMEEIRNAYDKMKTMERPHGKWLHNSDRPDNLICSVCNCGWDMWRYESKELKYCPNCGAKMEAGNRWKEEEDEE